MAKRRNRGTWLPLRSIFAFRTSPRARPALRPYTKRLLRLEPLEERSLLAVSPAGLEFRVNSHFADVQETMQFNPQSVAIDSDGDFVVTWSSAGQDGSGYGVYAQRFRANGARLGPELQVNQHTANNQRNSAVAMDDDGDLVVTWSSYGQDGSGYGIYGRRYDRAGAVLGNPFRINTTTALNQRDSAVAMDADGDFVVTWTSVGQDGSGAGIFSQRFNKDGRKAGLEIKVNRTTANDQDASRVAMDANGNYVVVWTSANQDGSGTGIFAQRFDNLGGFVGPEFRVNTTTFGDQSHPAVAMDRDGGFVVTWTSAGQDPDGSAGVFAQRYDASGVVRGAEFRINTTTADVQGFSSVSMDHDGNFVVTWSSLEQDGSGFGIFGRQFKANGTPMTGEFAINTTTFSDQRNSYVVLDADGDFVVAWTSDLADPDGSTGVYAQRFVIPNTAPTTTGIADVTVNEDAPDTLIDLFAAFDDAEDADSDLTFEIVSVGNPSLFDSVSITSANPKQLVLDYALNEFGISKITVRATDPRGLFVTTEFTVTIRPVNDAPTLNAISDPADILEDAGQQTINLSGITSGASNEIQALTVTAVSSDPTIIPDPTVSYSSADSTGSLSYTPVADAHGTVTITVTVKDDGGTANGGIDTFSRTFNVTVLPVNDRPTLDPIANPAPIAEDASQQTIDLSGIGSGAANENQLLTMTAVSSNRAIVPDPTITYASPNVTGSLSYTPVANANGTVTVTVTVRDNGGTANGGVNSISRTFTVEVTPVNDGPPTASDATVLANEDTDRVITLPGSVGVDLNETLTATVTSLPSRGRLFQTPDGLARGAQITAAGTQVTDAGRRVIFAPDADESGSPYTAFTFLVNDGEFDSAQATITVVVNPVNDRPTLDLIASPPAILEDSGPQTIALSGIGSGAANEVQALTVTATSNNPAIVPHPTVTYSSPDTTGSITYTPLANANGTVTITVTVSDDGGTDNSGSDSVSRSFLVDITPVNDGPPTATDDTVTGDEDTDLVITLSGSVGVDLNEVLTARVTSLPSRGSLFQTPDGVTRGAPIASAGALLTSASRQVIYAPPPDEFGSSLAAFRFLVNDGEFDSPEATVDINVRPVNDAPVAQGDSYVVGLASAPAAVNADVGVLVNDSDIEGDGLIAQRATDPLHGAFTLRPDGTFTYMPNGAFRGFDSFTYLASDGNAASVATTVTLIAHEAVLVRKLYRQVLGREPDPQGWAFWTEQVATGTASIGTVASGIFESPERLDPIVRQMYRDFLFRDAEAQGLAFWRAMWQRDGGPENVIAGIISSPEFFLSAGGTHRGWVTELYRRLLRREPDSQGLDFWAGLLDSGARTRPQVVLGFISSLENHRNLVREWSLQYLEREPDAGALDFFVGQLQSGVSQRAVQIQIIDSLEYRNRPSPPPAGVAMRI